MIAISQLIKIILGVFVIIAVSTGLFFLGSYVSDFFGNIPGGNNVDEESKGIVATNNELEESVIKTSLNDCGKCGDGFINRCNEIECQNLGNCKFESSFFGLANKCAEKNEK